MSWLQRLSDPLRMALGRLSQREQLVVLCSGAGLLLLGLLLVGLQVSRSIDQEEARVRAKTGQLRQVLALQGEYRVRKAEQAERLRTLGRAQVRLVSLVEDAARQAGVDIGQLRPEESEPGADGVAESRVDLRASGCSADRLQDFLGRLESADKLVVVRRIKVDKPYRRDTADVDMSVSTFRLRGN